MPANPIRFLATCIAVCVIPGVAAAQSVTVLAREPQAVFSTVMDEAAEVARISATLRSAAVGDTLSEDTAVIGGYTVIAQRIRVAGNRYEVRVKEGFDIPTSALTIHTDCLRDFFLARVQNPRTTRYGCFGGWGVADQLGSRAAIEDYMGGFRTGGMSSLAIDSEEIGLYTELASDNLFLNKGYARIGFGALVSAVDDDSDTPETDEEANATSVNQFYQGGGNATLYVALPAFYWRTFMQTYQPQPHFTRRTDVFLTFMASADVPNMGDAVQESAMNGRVGIQATFVQNTIGDTFNLFLHVDGSAGAGSNDFFDNLGQPESENWFAVGQVAAGFDINRLVRIGVTTGWSTMGANLEPRLSLTLIPGDGQ